VTMYIYASPLRFFSSGCRFAAGEGHKAKG